MPHVCIEVEVAVFISTLIEMTSIEEIGGKEILPKCKGTCKPYAGAVSERNRTVTFTQRVELSFRKLRINLAITVFM